MAEKQVNWNWRLLRREHDFSQENMKRVVRDSLDGIILANPNALSAAKCLEHCRFPAVLIGMQDVADQMAGRENVVLIGADNREIGKIVAEHLIWSRTFDSYAFVGPREDRAWARLRLKGFSERLLCRGERCLTYYERDDGIGQKRLAAFLRDLPKPAAVFTAYDDRALEVAGVCRELGIAVPGQISLVGVDNDPVICESGGMSLTSVDQDCDEIGYRAAEVLDQMMTARRNHPLKVLCCGNPKVVVRHSTEPDSRQARLVQEALAIIRKEAFEGVTAEMIAARLGVSRRLLDLRFRELQGRGVAAVIRTVRLAEVKRLLMMTGEPIGKIAAACGYGSDESMKRAFRESCGMSARDFRASIRSVRMK